MLVHPILLGFADFRLTSDTAKSLCSPATHRWTTLTSPWLSAAVSTFHTAIVIQMPFCHYSRCGLVSQTATPHVFLMQSKCLYPPLAAPSHSIFEKASYSYQ